MHLFSQADIEKYKAYFNSPKVIESADNIFDAIKNGNELESDNEKMASIALAYIKIKNYYKRKGRFSTN